MTDKSKRGVLSVRLRCRELILDYMTHDPRSTLSREVERMRVELGNCFIPFHATLKLIEQSFINKIRPPAV